MRARVLLPVGVALVLAACRSAPDPEPPAPPPSFPDAWTAIDLTRPLDRDTPSLAHPSGFPFERVQLEGRAAGRRAAAWSAIGLMGTHVEIPGVFADDRGATMERLPPAHLVVPAVVLDAPPALLALAGTDGPPGPGPGIGIPAILAHEALYGRVPRGSIVLLRTGDGDVASGDLGLAGRVPPGGYQHAGFAVETVRFLAVERGVRAVGTDALTIDPGDLVEPSPAAREAGATGLYTVSNLVGLGTLPRRGAVLVVGVLPVRGAAAAQARVLALVPPRLPDPFEAPRTTDAPAPQEPSR